MEINNNIKRVEINDYTIQLILFLQVNFNDKFAKKQKKFYFYFKD